MALGAALRDGNRVYLLTGQEKQIINLSDDAPPEPAELFIDLWAFDATTVRPIYRRRLQTIKSGSMSGQILGLHNRTLWLLFPDGPRAINGDTGAIALKPEGIAKINPNLNGLLPAESRNYTLTTQGLSVKTVDARTWYVHPDTFIASETPSGAPNSVLFPAFHSPYGTNLFRERGFALGAKWLGVLTEQEAANLSRTPQFGELDYQSRRALYSADIGHKEMLMGRLPRYSNVQRLTGEFVAPGLLAEHRRGQPNTLIYRRNPDSVFVLHTDRLGQSGRLQLTRVAGPAGKVLWTTPLPVSVLQSMMPDEKLLVLYGVLYQEEKPGDKTSTEPLRTSRGVLVSVDWETGAVRYHDQGDLARHPEAIVAP